MRRVEEVSEHEPDELERNRDEEIPCERKDGAGRQAINQQAIRAADGRMYCRLPIGWNGIPLRLIITLPKRGKLVICGGVETSCLRTGGASFCASSDIS